MKVFIRRFSWKPLCSKIIDFDMDKGILTTLIWLDMSWEDDYLKWDPEKFGGVDRMQLPPSKVWTPDIFLFNDVTGRFGDELKRDNPFLVVESNGHVRWIPPLVLKTMCDVASNEKETHTCELKFGSWVYNANQLDLISKISSMDLRVTLLARCGTWSLPVWRGMRQPMIAVQRLLWIFLTSFASMPRACGP
eukprot:TRINITY_DN2625_c0_g1_i2.p1 TRINITY_DN2625_c0_g1~~TRINITY_DN2625_c0_g1_i2.p1  ORF type:complete len:192 (-),score=48.47 TRINITY_DN2625_c0_g1_i2:109-684(-)